MDCYMDFCLLPDPEFTAPVLMNALFNKLHRALVEMNSRELGVSFPEYQETPRQLGNCLRLHGRAECLNRLMSEDWLKGLRDHLEAGSIEPVPEDALHCRVRRVQPQSSVERLRRRYIKRHGVTEEEAASRLPDEIEERVKLPFLRVRSTSTGQDFLLFLKHEQPQSQPVEGEFNTYGLSREATVPWF